MSYAMSSFIQFSTIFILLGWGIYLVYRAGQISAVPLFTVLIGAYTSAYLVRDLGLVFGLALFIALFISALVSFLIAIILARAPAFACAIASIALIFIGQAAFQSLKLFGGRHGFFGIPIYDYIMPLSVISIVIFGYLIYQIEHSRLGRAMEVIYSNEDLAKALGINIYKVRMLLQIIAGVMGSLAGILYAFSVGNIFAPNLGFVLLLILFCFLFVGGRQTLWGVLIFTPLLWSIKTFLPRAIVVWVDIIYGCLLVSILIIRPDGVIDKELIRRIQTKIYYLFKFKVIKTQAYTNSVKIVLNNNPSDPCMSDVEENKE